MEAAQQQLEIPATVPVREMDAKIAFLAVRVWQQTLRADDPESSGASQGLEDLIDEFDMLFGA